MLANTGQKTIKYTDNTETKHNPEKANNAKQNCPGSVASYLMLLYRTAEL